MSMPDPPVLVPLATLAAVLGVTRRRIQQLAAAGQLPPPISHGVYALEACVRAFIEHLKPRAGRSSEKAGYLESRAASEAARARLLTLEADEKEGDLVPRAEVRAEAFSRARAARDGLDQMRSRLAPLLAAESDPLACDQILAAEIRRICGELAGGKYGSN